MVTKRKRDQIDLAALSEMLKKARERKGWSLEELSHELWDRGLPTSQNKLWRMENKPPKRLDFELLLWLEKVLEVTLIGTEHQTQVLIHDVIKVLDDIMNHHGRLPKRPKNQGLRLIHDRAVKLYVHR